MRIIDCFPFNNETELLELRIKLLSPHVDKFVITEGDKTHTGHPKDINSLRTLTNLGLMSDKILLLKVSLPSAEHCVDNWVRERMQRDAAAGFISASGDVAFVSDCDEIMNPKYIKYYAMMAERYPNNIIRLPMHYLNCRGDLQVRDQRGVLRSWDAGFVCLPNHAAAYPLSKIRESLTRNLNNISFPDLRLVDNGVIEKCGWHFSWMGDNHQLRRKYECLADSGGPIAGAASDIPCFIDAYKPTAGFTDPLGRADHILTDFDTRLLPPEVFQLHNVEKLLFPDRFA